nr:DUF309 domain-containing protein [Actinocorallia populi]
MAERDRDPSGRPRNARPRDAYGRPLPYGSEGVPTMPDELELGPEETISEAQNLLDADRPFHAHEVLEAYWKACPEEERPLWRGLAQLAVGITHVRRGNEKGSQALFSRACAVLEAYQGPRHGLDVPGIVRGVRERQELRLR